MAVLQIKQFFEYLSLYFYLNYYYPPGALPFGPPTLIFLIILLFGVIMASIPLLFYAFKMGRFVRFSKMWQPWKKLSFGWAMIIVGAITGIIEFSIIILSGVLEVHHVTWTFIILMLSPLLVFVAITIVLTSVGIREFYHNASIALDPKTEIRKLRYLIAIYRKTGVAMYDRKLGDWKLDPILVGGFISAIQSFSSEIKHSTIPMRKMEYKDFEIIFEQGRNSLIALIIDGNESNWLRDKLSVFTFEFEKKFHDKFKNWDSELSEFRKSDSLIDRIFELYRLKGEE